jgi:hypothetical protein
MFFVIFALSLIAFQPANAIEVEYHLYPGWNLISVPCSTATTRIDSLLPVLSSAYYLAYGGIYIAAENIPTANYGIWVLSMIDTLVTITCECTDVHAAYRHRVTLQNQTEHSGIAVEILEAHTYVFTDSWGYYELPPLADGNYTLNFCFPYYKNERRNITIESGKMVERLENIELEQILLFSSALGHSHDMIYDTLHSTYLLSDTVLDGETLYWDPDTFGSSFIVGFNFITFTVKNAPYITFNISWIRPSYFIEVITNETGEIIDYGGRMSVEGSGCDSILPGETIYGSGEFLIYDFSPYVTSENYYYSVVLQTVDFFNEVVSYTAYMDIRNVQPFFLNKLPKTRFVFHW